MSIETSRRTCRLVADLKLRQYPGLLVIEQIPRLGGESDGTTRAAVFGSALHILDI
jgi:hypothetical protein